MKDHPLSAKVKGLFHAFIVLFAVLLTIGYILNPYELNRGELYALLGIIIGVNSLVQLVRTIRAARTTSAS
ncbi:hypothetical protein N781_16630 [Pontibacillus halophilus JSM 076056 = DSM 19796]|uniref:Uncharacterized protein n=1 Tax=Pontibacillus halophilus JSM 076056 = DSM 19796 TaxID=1385510 RepID=A0A0A5GMY9_9BACI|nr:hypothetical protein [Pontibacillus halophilus]KGX92495.1 hypothetical protein N781_16630 [Pontibacillus halophilus JSM 076056 = DSM 19796]